MDNAQKLTNLVKLSNFMRWFCVALMVVVIVAGVGISLVGALTGADWFYEQATMGANLGDVSFSPDDVGAATRLAIVAVNGVTLYFTFRGLWFLMQLFGSFSRREILTAEASQLLRKAGFSFLIVAIYGVVARTATVLLLTMGNPAGQKELAIGFGSSEMFSILLAGTLFAVGHVLSVAASIEEENKGFI